MSQPRGVRKAKEVRRYDRGDRSLQQTNGRRLSFEPLEDRRLLSVGAQLVADINLTVSPSASNPSSLVEMGGIAYFAASSPATGTELWKSDGTSAGTLLVKDICAGSGDSALKSLTNVSGTLFFVAQDSDHGYELWKSDGTSSGTILVKDIRPGNVTSYPLSLTNVNGTLFFVANDGTVGFEMWKSDGTSSGTVMVKDIAPGISSSSPRSLANVDGTLFFVANDGTVGFELWKSDGTSSGTVLVKDILPGTTSSLPAYFINVSGRLFFTAYTGFTGSGLELWQSDGTSSGTLLVKDIRSGNGSSTPKYLTNVGGTLFFSANDGTKGYELWQSDGTSSGTLMVKDIQAGYEASSPKYLANISGTLFFRANDGINGVELWKSDGTSSGTLLVNDITPGTSGSGLASFTNVSGRLFFAGSTGSGLELWQSDGTSSGTFMVKDIRTGLSDSTPKYLTNVNGTLFFRANDGTHGTELWKSDGASSGTLLVRDIRAPNEESGLTYLVDVNGTLFFRANDGTHGNELWKSDGTSDGTRMVKDILAGSSSSAPGRLTNVNGTLFFTALDPDHGVELWKSDGTSAGTLLVKDIRPGTEFSILRYLTNVNGTLFFQADDRIIGYELWKSDGTSDGTILVKDICAGYGASTPKRLTNVNGTSFFQANDGTHGNELWKSDGTSSGTVLVKDICPGVGSSGLLSPTNVNGTLFFNANDGTTGYELWKSDGTSSGTVLVKDIRPGTGASDIGFLTNVNGTLFFQANDGTNGTELWKSDGTSSGTGMVDDIFAGSGGSSAGYLRNLGAALFFQANDGTSGTELWKSDGTSSGTLLLKDIHVGSEKSNPVYLTNVNGTLFFQANDGIRGNKLWKSDGTADGTSMVNDFTMLGEVAPKFLTAVGATLFFVALDDIHGFELWSTYGATVTSITSPATDGSYKAGTVIPILVTFDAPVVVTGTPQLTLQTETTNCSANYSSGSGTATLAFSYTVQPGDTSADLDYLGTTALALSGGTICGSDGMNAAVTLPAPGTAGSLGANKNLVIDTTPPAAPLVTSPASTVVTGLDSCVIAGTAEVDALVQVYLDANNNAQVDAGESVVASQQLAGTNYSISTPLTAGTDNHFLVTATDAAGNESKVAGVPTITQQARATATLQSSNLNSTYGQSVTFTATVTGTSNTPSGKVDLEDGATVIATATLIGSGGVATAIFTTNTLSAGSQSLRMVYAGDEHYLGTTSNTITQNVAQAPLIVTPDNQTKTYGSECGDFTGTVAGIQNADAITAGYSSSGSAATASVSGGPYVITATLDDPDGKLGNYAVTLKQGLLTVNPAPLIVTPDNQTKTYGSEFTAFTGTVAGIQNGDAITAGCSSSGSAATASVSGGPYAIAATLNDPDGKLGDYSVTFNQGSLTVNKAPLIATPDDQTKTYGSEFAAFTGTITGIQNGDAITAGYSSSGSAAMASVPGGPYAITATLADPDNKLGNYAVTLNQGSLTVSPALLTVTATGIDKVYDGTTAASVTLTDNRLFTDQLTLDHAAATYADPNVGIGKNVTVDGIALSGGADAGNYILGNTIAMTTATITPAAIGPEVSAIHVSPNPVHAAATLTATASDANTGNYNILAAEYFVDSPGVSGKGRSMAAVDKKFNNPSEAIVANLSPILAKLSQGAHTLYVHARDASGKWGPFVASAFTKDTRAPVTSGVQVSHLAASAAPTVTATIDDRSTGQSNVVAAEYFLDKLGTSGKGSPMHGAFDGPIQTATATLSDAVFNVLSQGKHTLYVHGKDSEGQWGKALSVTFVKDTLGPAASGLKVSPASTKSPPRVAATIDDSRSGNGHIVAAEYFIDVPGVAGSGLAMAASDGRFSSSKEGAAVAIDATLFASLASGKHTIYVHGEDALGHWGKFASATFKKAGVAPLLAIQHLQAMPAAPPDATPSDASSRLNDAAILAMFLDSSNKTTIVKRDSATELRVVDSL